MKALPTSSSVSTHIQAVRLYRDDIEAIIGLLTSAGLEPTISDSRFQYDSVDELARAAGTSPKSLTIEGREADRGTSVTLTRSGRSWHLYSFGERFRLVALEIQALLKRRQSRVDALPLYWLTQAGLLVCWTAALIAKTRPGVVSTGAFAVGATLLVSSLALTAHWYLYPRLVLKYPHEAGFISRNRDAILLLVVGAAMGGIIQYILSRMLGVPS